MKMKISRTLLATLSAACLTAPFVFAGQINDSIPPQGGTFTVTPSTVKPTDTLTATFNGWSDNIVGAPLNYFVLENGTPFTGTITPNSNASVSFNLPEGVHHLVGRVSDNFNNHTDAPEVIITVDGTAPNTVFISGPSGTTTSQNATIEFDSTEPNSTFHATLDGNDFGVVTSPVDLTNLPPGPHTFTVSAVDAASNVDPTPLEVNWLVQPAPLLLSFAITGHSVPPAPGIQDGAVWTGFGTPAVSPSGNFAYIGKWKAPAQKTPIPLKAQNGIGIFTASGGLIVKVGDDVPGVPEAVFKSFRDPVVDDAGHIAFIASIKSRSAIPLPSNADTVVVAARTEAHNLELIAREGDAAPGTDGGLFKVFSNVALKGIPQPVFASTDPRSLPPEFSGEPGVAFTASLLVGSGAGVTTANDTGAWWIPGETGGLRKLVREGDSELFGGGDTVKTFSLLKAVGGSPGVDRGLVNSTRALLFTSTAAHQQVLFNLDATESLPATALGDVLDLGGDQSLKWAKLSLPSSDATGGVLTMLGALKTGKDGVPSATAKGIFQSHSGGFGWEPVVRSGDDAFVGPSGSTFVSFKDPVNSLDSDDFAFVATVKGTGITSSNNDTLWLGHGLDLPLLIAREGDATVPNAPGAKWKSFSSVAMPGGHAGPLFTASLVKGLAGAEGPGGITGANDFGFYATDYDTGAVFEIVREGQQVLGDKTVKSFSVLKAVPGSAGSARAFNTLHEIILIINFTDHTSGIVGVLIPGAVLPPL